jgi:hypothetical protein
MLTSTTDSTTRRQLTSTSLHRPFYHIGDIGPYQTDVVRNIRGSEKHQDGSQTPFLAEIFGASKSHSVRLPKARSLNDEPATSKIKNTYSPNRELRFVILGGSVTYGESTGGCCCYHWLDPHCPKQWPGTVCRSDSGVNAQPTGTESSAENISKDIYSCRWSTLLERWLEDYFRPYGIAIKVVSFASPGVASEYAADEIGKRPLFNGLDKEHATNSDIILLDFSTNDEFFFNENDKGLQSMEAGVESLIRKLLTMYTSAPVPLERPEIILLESNPFPRLLNASRLLSAVFSLHSYNIRNNDSIGRKDDNLLLHFPFSHEREMQLSDTSLSDELKSLHDLYLSGYSQIYRRVAQHYDLDLWSVRNLLWSSSFRERQPLLSQYLNFEFNASPPHPPWMVHLFHADLYATIIERRVNQCMMHRKKQTERNETTSTIAGEGGNDAKFRISPRYTISDSRAVKEACGDQKRTPLFSILAEVEFASRVKINSSSSNENNFAGDDGKFSCSTKAKAFQWGNSSDWYLYEDRPTKFGWIAEDTTTPTNLSTTAMIHLQPQYSLELDPALSFPLTDPVCNVIGSGSSPIRLKVTYLRTHKNAGLAAVFVCGKRIGEIDALWTDHSQYKYSRNVYAVFRLPHGVAECLSNSNNSKPNNNSSMQQREGNLIASIEIIRIRNDSNAFPTLTDRSTLSRQQLLKEEIEKSRDKHKIKIVAVELCEAKILPQNDEYVCCGVDSIN